MILGKSREKPEKPSCQEEIRIENTCASCRFRTQVTITYLRHPGQEYGHPKLPWQSAESQGYFWDQFGPFWSQAFFEEAFLFPLTTEGGKDDHAHKLGTFIRHPELSGMDLLRSGQNTEVWKA